MKRQFILLCTLFLFFYFNSFATILNVPSQYSTIQSAINASISGDTVLVQPGSYHENITIDSKNIVIGSLFLTTGDTSYITSTVIDGDAFLSTIVTYTGSVDTTSHLTGLTITGGDSFGNGGGISCIDASPTISYNTIRNNTSQGRGGGISCVFASPIISYNIIQNNSCPDLGGGIYLNSSEAIISNNRIIDNSTTSDMSNDGGGIYCHNSDIKITENYIAENSALSYGSGGGIYCYASNYQISNNSIENNSAKIGGGISIEDPGIGFIKNNEIIFNKALEGGGGIYSSYSAPSISKNIISNNSAFAGGGIYALSSSASIKNNTIHSDTASSQGGGIFLHEADVEIGFNVFHDNYSAKGAGIIGRSCSPTIENNTFSFNKSADCSAIWLDTPADTIRNNIFSFNHESPAIYTIGTILTHNNIYGNTAGNFQNSPFPGTGVISSVNINGDSCDVYKNIYIDPLFEDASNNDFQLTPDSPCIDAGDPASPNDPNNSVADIGALYYDYVLPVEFISFNVNVVEGKVQLNWSTATELNNFGFNIERNRSNSGWQNIGFIGGAGNSTARRDYSFIDEESISELAQYRLKQIDLNGSFEYSKVVEINLGLPTQFELSQNYPNPFNPTTKISFVLSEPSTVKISIFNSLGEKVAELLNHQMMQGYHSVDFDANNLTSGIYFYRIVTEKYSSTKKMMLLK